jgi:hypothetical protein
MGASNVAIEVHCEDLEDSCAAVSYQANEAFHNPPASPPMVAIGNQRGALCLPRRAIQAVVACEEL